MNIGFTGSQFGMSDTQQQTLLTLLGALISGNDFAHVSTFHHGDSTGADRQAHYLVERFGLIPIVIHPSRSKRYYSLRECCPGCDAVIKPRLPYLKRNQAIVDECDMLIATPEYDAKEDCFDHFDLNFGVWSLASMAWEKNKPLMFLKR